SSWARRQHSASRPNPIASSAQSISCTDKTFRSPLRVAATRFSEPSSPRGDLACRASLDPNEIDCMDLELRGKKAIVTGASRGIGRAIAEALAAESVELGICARNRPALDEALLSLRAKGVRALGECVDVADGKALKAWITRTGDDLGGVDILVT